MRECIVGTPGEVGQYWPSCEHRSPSSELHSALSIFSKLESLALVLQTGAA